MTPTEMMVNRPMPGQSLTQDPANKMAYEKGPKYNKIEEATEMLFQLVFDDDTTADILHGSEVILVDEVVSDILQQGFENGYWNPDLAMMLVETATYCVMTVAAQANKPISLKTDDMYTSHSGMDTYEGNQRPTAFRRHQQLMRSQRPAAPVAPKRSLIGGK